MSLQLFFPYYNSTNLYQYIRANYRASIVMVFVILRWRLVTVRLMRPRSPLLRTITTALPLKSFLSGCWNDWSEVASPLQAASNLPAQRTSKVRSSERVGQKLPLASVMLTVTKAMSSLSALMVVRSADRDIAAGLPAVAMVCSPITLPS